MPRSHAWTPPQAPSSHHRPPQRRRRREGIALGAAAVAVTLACTLAPATAAHAQVIDPGRGDGDTPGMSLGEFVTDLIQRLDESGVFEEAEELGGGESVSVSGPVTRVSLSEASSARVAKPDHAGRPLVDASTCHWVLRTRLEANYDESTRNLKEVTGTPGASLNCGGTFGLPVRQDGTLQHTLDGENTTTVASQDCDNDDAGCESTDVSGPYDCAGEACAGAHQFTLRHTWTLPAPYVWASSPSHCEVADDGTTLRCETRGQPVTIPSDRGGIGIGAGSRTARTAAA
jgi:hypothetical protein